MQDMSTELRSINPIRLIIAESSEQSADRFNSILRDAGLPTRVQLVDLPTAGDALPDADLMLCNAALPQLDRLLPQLRIMAPGVPIILVDHERNGARTAHGLRLGAADVVSGADAEELVLVFKRELEHVQQTRRVSELHHALLEAQARCELLLQTSEAAIAYVHEGMHIHANEAYLRLFGFTDPDEVVGLPLIDLLREECQDSLRAELKRLRQHDVEQALTFAGRSRSGRPVDGDMTLAPAHYEGEACVQVTVRAAVQFEREPPASATIANGHANGHSAAPHEPEPAATAEPPAPTAADWSLADFIGAAAELAPSASGCIGILVAQLDTFSRIQAEQGLRLAEQLATRTEQALREALGNCPIQRLAAHQYVIAIGDDHRGQLLARAEQALRQVHALSFQIGTFSLSPSLSIGGAVLEAAAGPLPVERVEEMLDAAFATVLRISEAGGARLELVGGIQTPPDPASETAELLAAIHTAIDTDAFALEFQPVISLRGEACEHYEVYLRMVDADGQHIRPEAFLDTAIEHGVAGRIDRWVILRAIKMLLAQRASGHDTRLTLTVTANSIADPEFPNWLAVALKAARLPSDAVVFQITETDAAAMVRQAAGFLQALKAMHCQSSLSRFGATPESLERLRQLPADYVKLDGALTAALRANQEDRGEVVGLLGALQAQGKLSIVPMVETAGMLAVLWQAGANFVQGNYLQPPLPDMNFDFSTAG